LILTTLVVLSEKLPLLSDSESGESMSQRGFYGLSKELEDEFYIHQKNNSYIIYSNETDLYLHSLNKLIKL
jgi:hypothetical protein